MLPNKASLVPDSCKTTERNGNSYKLQDIHFVKDQQAYLDLYSASSLQKTFHHI